jgi:hypothetical protein
LSGAYHQEQLRALPEHVRDDFARLDTGEIDEFELDDLPPPQARCQEALELLRIQWLQAASALEYMRGVARRGARLVGRERPPSRPDVSPAPLVEPGDLQPADPVHLSSRPIS